MLAGGAAKRLGGADKPGLRVGGRALLDRVLTACAGATTTVVVGGRRPTARPVKWTREEPAGRRTAGRARRRGAAHRRRSACSCSRPICRSSAAPTVDALLDELRRTGSDGALCIDADGRDQPLVAVYRAEPLRRELALLAAEHGSLAGLPLRLLTRELDLARVDRRTRSPPSTATPGRTSPPARARIREHGSVLDEWITAVKDELGIELDVDTGVLLDLARDAAHGVARPAAPLTTFLVGYAAAKAGGEGKDVVEAARKAAALAHRWAAEAEAGDGPKNDAG